MARHAMTAAAAALIWAGGAAPAQEAAQETVRISIDGTIVEVSPEIAAEACGLSAGAIGEDAIEAGAGDPDSASDAGQAGAAEDGAVPEATGDAAGEAEAEAVDPDAQTTNDAQAMAGDGAAPADDAPAVATPETTTAEAMAGGDAAAEGEAADAAATDPQEPIETADALCEISRDAAEALEIPAPD